MLRDGDIRVYEMQADMCAALANAKRLQILNLLKDGEVSVAQMVRVTGVSKANLSQHLAILRQRNLVSTRRQGTTIYYTISNPKITEACAIIRGVLIEMLKEKVKLSKRMQEVKL
ncbi:MAG TPA: metalloregulator ArsR/SmtB family transcription factor [Syntrophorhabdaceae bacterium]|nr:metalloregulator ArsR/SmtB family transcription factor [Syntrophorhabdaceae bacterium]